MAMARIKENDTVYVISGRDKGKQGKVIAILPKKKKVMVKGVAVATHHTKPRKQGEVGGIKKIEGYIALDKVMPVCTSCKKPCRISIKMLEGGDSARMCNRCKEII